MVRKGALHGMKTANKECERLSPKHMPHNRPESKSLSYKATLGRDRSEFLSKQDMHTALGNLLGGTYGFAIQKTIRIISRKAFASGAIRPSPSEHQRLVCFRYDCLFHCSRRHHARVGLRFLRSRWRSSSFLLLADRTILDRRFGGLFLKGKE